MICIYVNTGGKMKYRRVHTQNMRHTPPSVFGRHLSLCRPGESGFLPLALLLLACWMSSCKAVAARAGLCRSALRPGSRTHFLVVPLSHGTCDMTTAGFTRGNRPMQVVELNWLQSGVQARGDEAQGCVYEGLSMVHQVPQPCPSGRSFTGLWPQENF